MNIPVFLPFADLYGQRISAVSVSNKAERLAGKGFELFKSHAHGKDTGINVTLRPDNQKCFFTGIHNNLDVLLHT